MARPGKSIAKQSEGRAGEKHLPVGGRVRKFRAVGDHLARPQEKRVEECGAVAFFQKPVKADEWIATIQGVLGKQE